MKAGSLRNAFRGGTSVCCLLLCLACAVPAAALEKYGRPLPSMEGVDGSSGGPGHEEPDEPLFSGYLLSAAFLKNPTFAARPDNSGLVGLRHMLHLETDLIGDYLQFYTDQNFFSDRRDGWVRLSEWDSTYAFTGSVDRFSWRLQYERDAGLDRRTIVQEYADVLVTARFVAMQDARWWRRTFPQQNLTAYAGAGWLFHNSQYFARPDNTGKALFRYVAHADLDLYKNKVVLYADTNLFTDRQASNNTNPTELDWIVGLAVRYRDFEVAVYREEDRPLDRAGLVQKYIAVQLRYSFDAPKSWSRPWGFLR
ncbi:MAG: hypothetical protein U0172_10750 [Nitrospiraceae bacterium]